MKKLNITLIGDSIAKGITTENMKLTRLENCASVLVGQYLNTEINNLSVYGQTIKRVDEKGIVDKYIANLDKSQNNKLVFSIGGNDADYDWVEVAKSPSENHEPKTPEAEFSYILCKLIKKLQDNGVEVWLTGLPPVLSKLYFKNVICKIADGDKILEFYGGDITNIQRHQELYNLNLMKIANKMNCGFFDIRSIFLRERNIEKLYSLDGAHPNREGHRAIANEIIRQIIDYKKKSFILHHEK